MNKETKAIKDDKLIQEVLESIRAKTGLELTPDDCFTGVQTHKGKRYFNVMFEERLDYSSWRMKVLFSFASKYKTIEIESCGVSRLSIFF